MVTSETPKPSASWRVRASPVRCKLQQDLVSALFCEHDPTRP